MSNHRSGGFSPFESNPSPEAISNLESLIRSAGNYVVPSDDLRPSIIEAAKIMERDRIRDKKVLRIAAIMFAVSMVGFMMTDRLIAWHARVASRMVIDAERREIERSRQYRGFMAWNMFETVREIRNEQAVRLGQSNE